MQRCNSDARAMHGGNHQRTDLFASSLPGIYMSEKIIEQIPG